MSSSSRAILLASLSGLAVAMPAAVHAQDASDTLEADQPTIIVTGTRTSSRTVEDSPVPVDVLTNAAITQGGQV